MSDERVPEDREPAVADDMAGEYVAGSGTVVGFFYDLYDGSGEKIESRREGAPVLILFGEPSILAALQDALRGKQVGEDFSVTIPHGQAYGRRYPDRTQRISRKQFEDGKTRRFRLGEVVNFREQNRRKSATVTKVGKFHIDVDMNHPLAGVDLTFDVTVTEVRQASADELAHGHAHGVGGHQHH
jgi:FKBP-type peptidyl-prolyl cis-trans isomerase SlyD